MKPLNEIAENYFNTLNPIAERISTDIVAIKDAYEGLWGYLSSKEKNQIINETVVHPEAILKYTLNTNACDGVGLDIPLLTRQTTGAKYIVDESTGLSWRDEHSGPFSWKTPSQIDLCLFTSSIEKVEPTSEMKIQSINNKNKENTFNSSQVDGSVTNCLNKEDICLKKTEKNDNKKKGFTPLSSHNVVLVGTCSKLTGFCSKFKFLPSKSYSYEVQTVVSNPSNDGSFLDKLKTTAVVKLQNTFKLVGGRNVADKKAADVKESETLVQPKSAATIVRLSKPSPKVSKPKSPPPPPPVVNSLQKIEEKPNLIFVRNSQTDNCKEGKDSEKATLLGENSVQSFLSTDPDSLEQGLESKVTHELSDDFNSVSTECTPLSGPSTEIIPKIGGNVFKQKLQPTWFQNEITVKDIATAQIKKYGRVCVVNICTSCNTVKHLPSYWDDNMDHSQRGSNNDTSNAASSSSNLMPNVLFREIHKNAFLKRHSSDRRAGFPRKSERVWVVFCVHDDIEPFLEIYPDQKVALTHKPEWFASLSNVLHVSPTICGHEDEFEFAITLSFQVVRLSAPSWESMMEWVETIRNKLRELKVLCPKENIYSKMPEQKQPLLPTRDPNSPLPLPPEGPSTLLPGVELVHIDSRNNPAHENGRHQRISHSRSSDHDRRLLNKRTNLQERDGSSETSQTGEPSSSNNMAGENPSEGVTASASKLQASKIKIKRAASTPQPMPSTSASLEASNITVIEVSTPIVKESSVIPESSDNNDNLVNQNANENTSANNDEEEAHYEHVFLSSVPVIKAQYQSPQCKTAVNCIPVNGNKNKKTHSTNLLISSINVNQINSSQDENLPSTSNISLSSNSKDVLICDSASINISRNPTAGESEKSDNGPLSLQIQSKLEKVSITGLIPRVPAKSKAPSFKPASPTFKDSNLNMLEGKRSSESGCSFASVSEDQVNITNGESSRANTAAIPAYSQVKKIPKGKVKSEVLRSDEQHPSQKSSPVFPKRKTAEIQVVEVESHANRKPDNITSKVPDVKIPSNINAKIGSRKQQDCVITSGGNDITRNHQAGVVSNSEYRSTEVSGSGPSTSGNSSQVNLNRKESFNGSNNNPESEPITAIVQPAVGVISVEDIPLIGGHQRRRRRSSSSDPSPANNIPSSRGIVGADRIRINVPNNSARETARTENEIRSACHGRNATESNPSVLSSRLTLREKQVLQLKKEMLHPGGVRLQLRRKDCTGSIALVDVLNGVWVAGWKQKEHPLLYNALHIGDQLISIGEVLVRNSAEAQKLIRCSTSLYIEFIIRRVPFGSVFALQRSSEGQSLGIVQEGNTAEIKDVVPNSIAARQGLTSKTPSYDGLSLTTWFLTEINGRPLNLFFKDNEVKDRLNAVGKEISILVQPHDFIKQIKKQLKNIRSYKDYIVQ